MAQLWGISYMYVTGITFGNSIFLRRLLVIVDWLYDAAAKC